MSEREILYIVAPCYNEEEVIDESAKQLLGKLERLIEENKISSKSKILFVNDGSTDRTWNLITEWHAKDKKICGVNLSGNVGHQNALLAGMMAAKEKADIVITIDADLQQDIEAIDMFLEKYNDGCDIVYGIRNSRSSDKFLKKLTALGFYKIINLLGGKVKTNHADYRLMSKRSLDALGDFKEVNLFLRGVIPMLGFKSDVVYFEVKERFAGQSKYTISKMFRLAMDGITSLSIRPIRIITAMGAIVFIISCIMTLYCLIAHLMGNTVVGWTSNICVVWSLGGLQLLSLGIVGEYVGKTYMETKQRPRYIIEAIVWDD